MMNSPVADRPQFPEGYGTPTTLDGLLPWSHAVGHLERALVYWVGTVRPNGRPHVSPIWGVWLDNRLYFDGSPAARRSQNIAQNPAITVHLDSEGAGKDVVMLEGDATEVFGTQRSDHFKEQLAAQYAAKYAADGYKPEPSQWDNGGLIEVQPRLVIAWTGFNVDPTRWRFH